MCAAAGDNVGAIGIDVGGTKIAGGIVRFPSGNVISRELIPTDAARGPDSVLADVAALADRLRGAARSHGIRLAGVGIGVPELVDLEGRITSGQTIDWRGLDLADRLAIREPVRVESDVRAAALAEALYGAGRAHRIFAYVTVGTGISSTLVQDGRPFAGARGNALVLASGATNTTCTACGATSGSILEEIASGPALVQRYNQVCSNAATSGEDVLAAADAGDPAALTIVREAGEALGGGVGFLVNVLDPEAIIIGGGLGLARGAYWDAFVESARRHIWAEATRGLAILQAELGPDAGLIGAAHGVGTLRVP